MSARRKLFQYACGAAALFSLVLVSGAAAADEPERPVYYDSSVYPPPSTRYKLALVGVAVSATWYGAAYGASALWPDAPGADDLRVPVAGPWMALGKTGCADDEPDCSTIIVVLRAILTTVDGVGQAGGLAVAAEALFLPTSTSSPPPRRRHRPSRVEGTDSFQLRPAPLLTGRTLGLGVVGTF
jgi:hypothetical protein